MFTFIDTMKKECKKFLHSFDSDKKQKNLLKQKRGQMSYFEILLIKEQVKERQKRELQILKMRQRKKKQTT